MSLKLAIFQHLPPGMRKRIAEGRIGDWLRQHGASEEETAAMLNGYKTIIAAVAGIATAVGRIAVGISHNDPQAVSDGTALLVAGIGVYGVRTDSPGMVGLGSIGSLLAAIGSIAYGVTHDFNIGEILTGLHAAQLAAASLGIFGLHAAVNTPVTRAARMPGAMVTDSAGRAVAKTVLLSGGGTSARAL